MSTFACDDHLMPFRTQAEMAHTCRGTINLVGAIVETLDACSFVISNGGTQTFYLRTASEVERQKWVTALELAKAETIKMTESGEYERAHVLSSRRDVYVVQMKKRRPLLH